MGRERQGRGQNGGLWGWVRVCCVGVSVRLRRRARVVSAREDWKRNFFCGKDFTDEWAYWVHLLVGGGKRVL